MNQEQVWKYAPSCLYREKQFNILRQIGRQSLKRITNQTDQIRRTKKNNLSLQNSFEKLPKLEKTNKNFFFPPIIKLDYPEPIKEMTIDEYSEILKKRIREEEQKKKWILPKLELLPSSDKFSFRSNISCKNLRRQIEQYQLN